MAMTNCKECKAQISTKAESCPQCGAKRKKTSGCAIVIVAFVGLSVLMGIVRGCSGSPPTSTSSSNTPSSSERNAAPAAAVKPDPAAVLAEAKKTVDGIEARLKATTERLKNYYGTADQVKEATADLLKLAVIKGLYEKSNVKDEKRLGDRADSLIAKVSQQQRATYASASEEIFVKSGMDVKVAASGIKKDQLRLKYVLMSKPLVYKFQNEVKISEQARVLGFKKIIYTDGYNETWTETL